MADSSRSQLGMLCDQRSMIADRATGQLSQRGQSGSGRKVSDRDQVLTLVSNSRNGGRRAGDQHGGIAQLFGRFFNCFQKRARGPFDADDFTNLESSSLDFVVEFFRRVKVACREPETRAGFPIGHQCRPIVRHMCWGRARQGDLPERNVSGDGRGEQDATRFDHAGSLTECSSTIGS